MILSFILSVFGVSIEASTLLSLMTLNTLNSFVYPHYIVWFLPWLYIELIKMDRDKTLYIALISTLTYSAIALMYWKYYRVTNIIEALRVLYYTTTIILAIHIFRHSIKYRAKDLSSS